MTGKRSRLNRKSKSRTAIPSRGRRFALFNFRPVLEGEDAALYDDLVTRTYEGVKPVDVVEEMYLADVIFLQWELMRWHRLKFKLMQTSVHQQLRDLLSCSTQRETFRTLLPTAAEVETERIDGKAKYFSAKAVLEDYARREPEAVKLINDLLALQGRTTDDLMVTMLSNKFDEIERIDRQAAIAEARRNVSLREIDRRRAVLGEALRRTLPEVDGEFKMIETTPPQKKTRHDMTRTSTPRWRLGSHATSDANLLS